MKCVALFLKLSCLHQPPFDNLTSCCQPLSHCRPHFPLLASNFFCFPISNLTFHCQPHFPLPTSITIVNLIFQFQPQSHCNLESFIASTATFFVNTNEVLRLRNRFKQSSKSPLANLIDLTSS